MNIYENIIIGNFLYGFGVAMGKCSDAEELPLSVNLLQQTPLDRGTGDVLVRGARMMRLLEFKSSDKEDDKETAKLTHLQRTLSNEENADLVPISREVHWYIARRSKNDWLDLRIVPYLDFQNTHIPEIDLRELIEAMVSEATGSTFDKSLIYSRYLYAVAISQGSIKGSSGGLIVSTDESGAVNYVVIEDLRELGLELTKLQALYHQRQSKRQRQYEHQRSRRLPDLQKSRGLTR